MRFDLFLTRHGETEWNWVGRKQGHLDSALTSSGTRHAELQAIALTEASATRIFSSPLGRALETARIMSRVLNLPITVLDDLSEIHHGDYAGRTAEELEGEAHWANRRNQLYTWTFPGGESYQDADVRAARALDAIEQGSNGPAVIVSHEMIGRMLVRNLCDLATEVALSRRHPHGVVYRWQVRTRGIAEYPGTR